MDTPKTIHKYDKKYMTYGEILRFAIENLLAKDTIHGNTYEVVECFKSAIIDINDAIEDREILPVNLTQPKSRIGDILYYFNFSEGLQRLITLVIFCIVLIAIEHDVNSYYLVQKLMSIDLIYVLRLFIIFAGIIIFIRFNRSTNVAMLIRILDRKSDTPTGMIKYQLTEASFRGYKSSVYSTSSVLMYLNSKYGFNFKSYEYKKSYERYISSGAYDKVKSLSDEIIDILIHEVDELKQLFSPPETNKDDEMSELSDKQYAPVRQAKKQIMEFIESEIPPPCTCYHTQIARYILDNQGKDGFEAPLTYVNRSGKLQTISKDTLLDISKTILQKFDPNRVQNSKVELKRCLKHNYR